MDTNNETEGLSSSSVKERISLEQISQASVMNESNEEEPPKISKRMRRKLMKREKWLASVPAKRMKERERQKEKRKAARENNILLPSRKLLKQASMARSNCKIRVAIDLDFDELMNSKDLGKCVKQLMRCYTLNRRARNPMQLYFTSFNGKSKQEMSKNNGYSNWDVNFKEEAYTDVFQKNEIVYLSSESDNMIKFLEESKVYVIGGLVDHNVHKGLCHSLANQKNIAHGQLPISEFLTLKSRKVLTIDHVFEILLGVSEGLSWKEAFLKVLPQRKLATNTKETVFGSKTSTSDILDSNKSESSEDVLPLKTSESPSEEKEIVESPKHTNKTVVLPDESNPTEDQGHCERQNLDSDQSLQNS